MTPVARMNLLEASVEVSGRAGHDGLDEEGLLTAALLVAPHDAEAPAVVVGLQEDDVAAPVHVTGGAKGRRSLRFIYTSFIVKWEQGKLRIMDDEINWT